MRKQPIGEAVQDSKNANGMYWEPEREIAASQAHLHLVKSVAGSRRVRFFETRIYDIASNDGLGTIQVAIDEIAGEACGILLTADPTAIAPETTEPIFAGEATAPVRFACVPAAAKAVAAFCNQPGVAGALSQRSR